MSKTILVLGGNGFIGAEVTERLLDLRPNDYRLVLINRGSWSDWDTAERIKSRVHQRFVCDRENHSFKLKLKEYLEDGAFRFEAVIDFSAFKSRAIKNTLRDIPAQKIKLYILISTDSVYEVSVRACEERSDDVGSRETDAVRPSQTSERKRFKEFDSYGHHKFKCEETLIESASVDHFAYVILRLPDVIGPRDSTNRFWLYQMMLQYIAADTSRTKHEILIPKAIYSTKTSYVYVKDVARVIQQLICSPNCHQFYNQVFNIACTERVTLIELIKEMACLIRPGFESELNFKCSSSEARPLLSFWVDELPSVTRGPVSVEKARQVLRFEPTSLRTMLQETIDFFSEACKRFPKMRKQVERDIRVGLLQSEEERGKFDDFISNLTS